MSLLDQVLSSRPRQSSLPQISPEEEQDLISQILGYGGSALSFVGNVLDYPGAFVRGGLSDITDVLQGNTFENKAIESLNPYQWDERTSGRNLLEQWGVAGENSDSWIPDAGDIGGFGLEILTDPTSYMTFGAKTAAGRVAASQGRAAKTLAQGVRRGQNALIGLGLPFSQPSAFIEGQGVADAISGVYDQARYGKIKDLTGGAVNWEASPGSWLASLFSPHQAVTPEVSRAANEGVDSILGSALGHKDPARMGMERAYDEADQMVRDLTAAHQRELKDIGLPEDLLGAASEYRTDLLERPEWSPTETTSGVPLWDSRAGKMLPQDARELIERQAREEAKLTALQRAEQRDIGLPVKETTGGGYNYVHRQAVDMPGESNTIGRQRQLDDIVGGTNLLRESIGYLADTSADLLPGQLSYLFPTRKPDEEFDFLSSVLNDPKIGHGVDSTTIAAYLEKKYGKKMEEMDNVLNPKSGKSAFAVNAIYTDVLDELTSPTGSTMSAEDFVRKLRGRASDVQMPVYGAKELPPTVQEKLLLEQHNIKNKYTPNQKDVRLFGRDKLIDFREGALATQHQIVNAKFAQSILGKYATKVRDATAGDVTALGDALMEIGFTKEGDETTAFLKAMGNHIQPGNKNVPLKDLVVPTAIVSDLRTMFNKSTASDSIGVISKVFDPLLNTFKAGALTWPGRWARDLTEGMLTNVFAGHASPSSASDAVDIIFHGKAPSNWAEYLNNPHIQNELTARGIASPTEKDVFDLLREKVLSTDLLSSRQGVYGTGQLSGDIASTTPARSKDMLDEVIGDPFSLSDITSRGSPINTWDAWNPFAVRGLPEGLSVDRQRLRTGNKLLAMGEKIGMYSDEMNRMVPFLDMLKDGWEPLAARKQVDALQVNYRPESFSPFERKYLKRLVPFYSFQRKYIPQFMKMLGQNPGGIIGQAIRGQRIQEETSIEDPNTYLRAESGLAIPVGEDTVIQGVALPTDIINQTLARPSDGLIEGSLRKLGANLRPELKIPIELATGTNLFFGEPVSEQYGRGPIPGATTLNAILQNTVPRYTTAVRRFSKDPLDAMLQTFTNLHMDDTAEGAVGERERDFQRIKEKYLEGEPGFRKMEKLYVDKSYEGEIPDYLAEVFQEGARIEGRGRKERRRKQKEEAIR